MRSFLGLLLVSGCSEVSLSSLDNDPPEPAIYSHREGDVLLESYPVVLAGTVSDDGPLEDIVATWFVDDQPICNGPLDELGNSTCTWLVPPGDDEVRIRLEGADARQGKGSVLLDLAIAPTLPPTVEIAEPVAATRYYSNIAVPLTGTAADAEDQPTALTVSWTSDRDGALPSGDAVPDGSGAFAGSALLAEGRHALIATVTDGSGKTGTDTVTIDVGGPNRPPTCTINGPPDGAESGQFNEVVFVGVVDDLDEPADLLEVVWDSDGQTIGVAQPTLNGDVNFPYDVLPLGVHTITMTATDGAGASCSDSIQHVVVEPPSAPDIRISPDFPERNDDLVCLVDVPSVDPQGQAISYVFEWFYDGALFTGPTGTFAHPGDTIPSVYTAPGQVWECHGRGTDGNTTSGADVDAVTILTPTVRSVVAGGAHTCQLDTGDELQCWGSNSNQQLSLNNGFYTSVGAGLMFTCGVDLTGDLWCVGANEHGQSDAPAGNNWVSVAANWTHACAIDTLGAVTCWGQNDLGQSDTSGLAGVYLEASLGAGHGCAVRDDLGLDCWGTDAFGRATPTPGVQWAHVAAGAYHTCGLEPSGLAACFGNNAYGEGSPPGGTFTKLSAGLDVTCGVRGAGDIVCWGRDTGAGEAMEAPLGLYTDVTVGTGQLGIVHACAVDIAGAVVCWGDNSSGQASPPAIWW